MNYLKVICLFILIGNGFYAYSQESNESYLEVDSITFQAMSEWTGYDEQHKGKKLLAFLKQKVGKEKADAFLKTFKERSINKQLEGQEKNIDDCACLLLVLGRNHLNHPEPIVYPETKNERGIGWSRKRIRFTHVAGAVHREYLHVSGKGSQSQYTSSDNSSWSRSRVSFNWVCLNDNNDNIPSDCDCDKELRIDALYESKISVSAEARGLANKAAFTKAEDGVVIFAYDHQNLQNNDPNLEILGAKTAAISTYARQTWNPQAIIDIVELTGTIVAAAVTGGWTEEVISNTIPSKIADIISEPLIFNQGSTNSSSYAYDKILSVNVHDGMLILKPNVPKSLVVAPTWNVFGRGYGSNWKTNIEIASNFSLGMMLKRDNSNPYCCIKQIGKYNYGTVTGAPSNVASLTSNLNSFFSLYGPWQGTVSTSNTSAELLGTIDCPPIPDPCSPIVEYTLNGQTDDQCSTLEIETVILNLRNSHSCTGDYYISISPSDSGGSPIGAKNEQWLSQGAIDQFGGLSAFNLREYNESFGTFSFEPEKYYRIKVGLGEGDSWTEKAVLLYIEKLCIPYVSFSINNQNGNEVSIYNDEAIILDFSSAVSCMGYYFVSIQESDPYWTGIGPENMLWLSEEDVLQFGGKTSFNLKAYNSRFGTFNFQRNRHYRIKVAVNAPWTDSTILCHIRGRYTDGSGSIGKTK